jgi:cold shock CspA family protein
LKDKDVFVHYSSIQVPGDQYKYLVQGEYVDFELSKSDKSDHEYHAVAISGVKGGSLMCETRRQTQEKRPYKPRVYKTPDEGSSTAKPESKTGGRAKRDEAKDTAPADGFTKVSKRGKPIAK